MNEEPLVSVVIPVYNRLDYLAAAIESALAASGVTTQVIVVDDGSPVDPGEVVGRFGDRIELIRKANGGLASARNAGVMRARGRFVHFLDDDDVLEPGGLASLLAATARIPNQAWAVGRFRYIDHAGGPVCRQARPRVDPGDLYETLIGRNVIGAPSAVLVRTDVVNALGGFDESFRLCEDYDFWLALSRDYPAGATQDVVTNYRIHPRQISTTQWNRHHDFHLMALEKHRARSRPRCEHLFDLARGCLLRSYGDDYFVAGDHVRARSYWRLARAAHPAVRDWPMTVRFGKSYVPSGLLRRAREAVRAARRSRAPSVGGPAPG